jgi:hypothetical protein
MRNKAVAERRLAKAEPKTGCYFSVFVGPDRSLRKAMQKYGGTLEDQITRLLGKEMAVQWLYFYYNNPAEVAAYLRGYKNRSFVMQVALEPRGTMKEIQDDEVLRQYATMMAAYKRPLFLRFASEMNGLWAPYHGDPALYREKFRLVARTMQRYAPNVIMLWCVSHTPRGTIEAYYPGDSYVDWVGVNFYSVLHHNSDLKQPAHHERPTDMLDYVYRKYASRKPIAICEYGASRQERIQPTVDKSAWAAGKLTELLTALPKRYPRVKMVGLFNVNTMQPGFQSAGGRANNFCFSDSPVLCDALRRVLKSPYYLSRVVEKG